MKTFSVAFRRSILSTGVASKTIATKMMNDWPNWSRTSLTTSFQSSSPGYGRTLEMDDLLRVDATLQERFTKKLIDATNDARQNSMDVDGEEILVSAVNQQIQHQKNQQSSRRKKNARNNLRVAQPPLNNQRSSKRSHEELESKSDKDNDRPRRSRVRRNNHRR